MRERRKGVRKGLDDWYFYEMMWVIFCKFFSIRFFWCWRDVNVGRRVCLGYLFVVFFLVFVDLVVYFVGVISFIFF